MAGRSPDGYQILRTFGNVRNDNRVIENAWRIILMNIQLNCIGARFESAWREKCLQRYFVLVVPRVLVHPAADNVLRVPAAWKSFLQRP